MLWKTGNKLAMVIGYDRLQCLYNSGKHTLSIFLRHRSIQMYNRRAVFTFNFSYSKFICVCQFYRDGSPQNMFKQIQLSFVQPLS